VPSNFLQGRGEPGPRAVFTAGVSGKYFDAIDGLAHSVRHLTVVPAVIVYDEAV
jgi:hypothetical protein